jgi:protein SCO1/2
MSRRWAAALAALVLAGALAGCTSSHSGAPASPHPSGLGFIGSGPYQGFGVDPPRPRPDFTLTDTQGRSYDFGAQTKGHPTLLYFGYTDCPDICPATMADIGLALKSLPTALQKRTDVVFVSTDVRHDTDAIIAKWLTNFSGGNHATWVGLRGTRGEVNLAQAAAHVFLAEDGGQQHSTQVMLYGADNYAHDSFVYNNTGEQKQIAHDLPIVARG